MLQDRPLKTNNYLVYSVAILMAIGASIWMSKGGIATGMILLALPPIIIFMIVAFAKPHLLIHLIVLMGFLIVLISRYSNTDIPFGLTTDLIMLLVIIVLILNKDIIKRKEAIFNPLTLALLVWLGLTILEILNPLAASRVAWFYAIRALALYPVILVIITILIFDKKIYLKQFLFIWAVLELIASIWGMKQLFFGVSATEQAWLNAGAAQTHILFGRLRVFSFMSDAAQFGATQAHAAIVFGIIGLYKGNLKYRFLILAIAAVALYGMLISGTRGALGILALGGFTYFTFSKNFRIVLVGLAAAGGLFIFLKYTTILQSNYQINRLRTALNTEDASFMVRKRREQVLKNYMADKPFGGGVGSAGFWGQRFSPGSKLATLGTDGHYTRIWMETGIIGLVIYLGLLAVIIAYLGKLLWKMPDSLLKQILVGFYSGFLGLCLSSYTNGLITQIPTSSVLFITLGFVYLGANDKLE